MFNGWMRAIIFALPVVTGTVASGALTIPACETPPIVDGELDDLCWNAAAKVERMFSLKAKGNATSDDTTAVLCRDRTWLYIGLQCGNTRMNHVVQTIFDHDGPVQRDESVEIFLAPGTGKELYYHFMLSFANVRNERRIDSRSGRDVGWNTPWRSVTHRTAEGWSAEIAIPLFALSGGELAEATMNVCRNKMDVILDPYGAKLEEKTVFTSWSRLDRSAHEPQNFMSVSGLGGFTPQVPFAPLLDSASVGGFAVSGAGETSYPVTVTLRRGTNVHGTVRVCVTQHLEDGTQEDVAKLVTLGAPSEKTVITIPADSLQPRTVTVALTDPETGSLFVRSTVADVSALEVMSAPLTDRDYYTTELEARVRCRVGITEDILAGARLDITRGDDVLISKSALEEQATLTIPIASLEAGTTQLRATLRRGDRVLDSREFEIVKLDPNPAREIKIDQFNRVLLDNGTPFFPFAMFMHHVTSSDEYAFEFMRDVGFNTLIRLHQHDKHREGEMADTGPYMELAAKHGLKVLEWGGGKQPYPIEGTYQQRVKVQRQRWEKVRPKIVDVTRTLREHANLIGYQNVDEPNLVNPDMRITVAEWYWKTVKPLDPYRPHLLLYARHIPYGDNWTRWGKILGYDVYTCPDWDGFHSQPGLAMAYYTCMVGERAKRDNKVMVMIPLSGQLDPIRCPIALTRAQQLCQSYTAIIYGAKGLLYFAWPNTTSSAHWDALRELGEHVRELSPAILNESVAQSITYSPGRVAPHEREFPAVNAAVFRYPDGRYVMLAANIRPVAVHTTFDISGLVAVARLFADQRPLALDGSVFTDDMEPYGVRAYVLELSSPVGQASSLPSAANSQAGSLRHGTVPTAPRVTVAVTMKEDPERIAASVPLHKLVRQLWGAKNVIPNPLFENQKVPGLPDFVRQYLGKMPDLAREGSVWYLDEENPWRGHNALRMRYEMLPSGARKVAGATGVFYPPPMEDPEPYVFSFYARGDSEHARVGIIVQDWELKYFKLTTSWQRYHLTGLLKPGDRRSSGGQRFTLYVGGGSTVWIDGVQMEKGTQPTPFEDCSNLTAVNIPADPENLVANGHAEYADVRGWNGLRPDTGVVPGGHTGKYCFSVSGTSALSAPFPIDPDKAYRLSGWFRDEGDDGKLLFGLVPYDAQKRRIWSWHITQDPKTRTLLAAPCNKNDRVLRVKDASGWQPGRSHCVAFEGDKELPNFNVTALGISRVSPGADAWEIELSKPCGLAFPSGTVVAQHRAGTNAIFAGAINADIPETWAEFSGSIRGRANHVSSTSWWPGTAYAAVMAIRQPYSKNARLFFDDIAVRKMEE